MATAIKDTNFNMRMLESLYSSLGMTLPEAVNIFFENSLLVGGLPFNVRLPRYNRETEDAIQEARDIMSGKVEVKSYSSARELFDKLDELDSEDLSLLESLIDDHLLNKKGLDEKYLDHPLAGNYLGFRECHIQPDWLLNFAIDHNKLILTASRTGSHSDLF